MCIRIKIPKLLLDKTDGALIIEVRGSNVFECISDLICRYPKFEGMILDSRNRLLLKWMIYVNNQGAVSADQLSYPVKEGDMITLLPMIAGG
jgi:molybdopterin converting factor small subunit